MKAKESEVYCSLPDTADHCTEVSFSPLAPIKTQIVNDCFWPLVDVKSRERERPFSPGLSKRYFKIDSTVLNLAKTLQRPFTASTPSPMISVVNPDFCKRLATSRGTSRPLVSLFGVPV